MIIRPNNVVIDVDGVLADFNTPFAKKLSEVSGISLDQFTFTEWHWYRKTGIDKALVTQVWDEICEPNSYAAADFWLNLAPTRDAYQLIRWICDRPLEYTPYFVTARSPVLYDFTFDWLKDYFDLDRPRLIMSEHKGLICSGLDATHFIDDKYDNCLNVLRMRGTSTLVCVLDQPYNKPPDAHHYIRRLPSLRAFLELLKRHASGRGEVS